MLKARGTAGSGQPVLFLGVSWDELRKLRAGVPFVVDLDAVGLDGVVVLFAGAGEETLHQDIKGIAASLTIPTRAAGEAPRESFFPIKSEDQK